jgi:hypothetical protein
MKSSTQLTAKVMYSLLELWSQSKALAALIALEIRIKKGFLDKASATVVRSQEAGRKDAAPG